ncbi:MAG: class I SAM-dependent methyltransferase [Thermoleophilia bacterium]|nr:class I SAM-dependent methyltransferase [Thermoleophilia bacterium]MDH4339680.1 class I SAM-dependent methyltransferase [Thermoleophilia bacterium]MDH5280286.1 class I SAM-dependent methyltransferase [Thermoleophilia bacterium]
MRLVDHVSLRSRRRKLRLFLEELHPTAETSVLDVGADELAFGEGDGCGTLNFFEEHYPWPERITALGLQDGTGFRARYPNVGYVQGDACALPFADGEFDIIFSNAVIEHVGDRERQRQLISEAIRVGRRVFITTPNRRFPVEVHTRLPIVHWLPDRLAHPAYRAVGKSFATDVHLLSKSSFEALFPGRVRIVNLGLTLVAIVD